MANSLASLFRSPIEDFHVDSLIGATTTGCGLGPSAGKSSFASPPAKAAPPPVHECDISFVDVAISRPGGTTRQLTIPAASNQKGGQTRIDVLANPRKDLPGSNAKDTTQLSLTVVAFASCSGNKHPLLTVTPAAGGDGECKAVAGVLAKHSTPIYRTLRSWEDALVSGQRFEIWNLLQWFWGAIGDEQAGHIDVTVATCGARKAGTIVGGVSLSIHVYPIESYSVTFGLPPLWSGKREESKLQKTAYGSDNGGLIDKSKDYFVTSVTSENKFFYAPKSGTASSNTSQTRDMFDGDVKGVGINQTHREVSGDGVTAALDRLSLNGDMGKLNFSRTDDDPKPWERLGVKLELKRNGADLAFEAGKFLTSISTLAEAVKKFREGLSSAVQGEASLGLTMSGELNFLVIDLTATWQRKELAGPRVPWNVAVSLMGKLIDASLSAKYGLVARYTCLSVEVVNVELSATLTFAGEVPIARTRSATVVDGSWTWSDREFPVEATLSATLAAVGKAIVMGQGVQAEASAKASLKLESKFDSGKASLPPQLSGDINFTGVVLTVTASNTIRGTQYVSKPITLVDPRTLVQGFIIGHG